MLNVMWWRFNQSAKQLIVGHTTIKYDDPLLKMSQSGPRATFSTSGSYLKVTLTTVHNPYTVDHTILLTILENHFSVQWTASALTYLVGPPVMNDPGILLNAGLFNEAACQWCKELLLSAVSYQMAKPLPWVNCNTAIQLVWSLVLSRLDYNTVLSGVWTAHINNHNSPTCSEHCPRLLVTQPHHHIGTEGAEQAADDFQMKYQACLLMPIIFRRTVMPTAVSNNHTGHRSRNTRQFLQPRICTKFSNHGFSSTGVQCIYETLRHSTSQLEHCTF